MKRLVRRIRPPNRFKMRDASKTSMRSRGAVRAATGNTIDNANFFPISHLLFILDRHCFIACSIAGRHIRLIISNLTEVATQSIPTIAFLPTKFVHGFAERGRAAGAAA
jgi:hypothetical protein